jgi:choice-of-anchor B domain-containing protein
VAGLVLGAVGLVIVSPVEAQFESEGIELYRNLDLGVFGANSGNDCWGYVSESGREYALMGLSNKVAVVEITDPAAPVVVQTISHSNSLWGDIKTYGHYAYAVTEGGTGIQIIDLDRVDEGIVTLVRTLGSPSSNHNIAVDERSGYLYTCGSSGGSARTVIFDLSDPVNPVEVGTWATYEHDMEVVTFQSGPYAGRQIMFGSSEGRGVDIVDVTNKANAVLLSRTPYPGVSYCHQSWLDEESMILYVDDELDEQRGQTPTTRTMVFDVSDINAPTLLNTFTSGSTSIDHNLYIRDNFLYEANYTSGLRVFDLSTDPIEPDHVGFFDTYPGGDPQDFNGAWSVYPFFPSGTVIVSDLDRGLFVLDVSGIRGSLQFSYPNGRPDLVDPAGGVRVRVEVTGRGEVTPEPGTGTFHYDVGDGFQAVAMEEVADNIYDAVFPSLDCFDQIAYYVSAESTDGEQYNDPSSAPASFYTAIAATGVDIALEDNFETDNGWVGVNRGATSGDWQRGVPVNDQRWDYAPIEDGDGSGRAWLTENDNNPNYQDPWNTDVDGGAVELDSPIFDMSQGGDISYLYYLNLTRPQDNTDVLRVEINSDGGNGAWIQIARHNQNQGRNWTEHVITQGELSDLGVTMTDRMRLRFTANDADQQSIVEAGVDGFRVSALVCEVGGCVREPAWQCDGDVDGDAQVNPVDSGLVQAAFGSTDDQDLCNYDVDCDGQINPVDSGIVQSLFGTCEAVREVCP